MWTLKNPGLESAKEDIPRLIENSKKLDERDKVTIEALYREYDARGGRITGTLHRNFSKNRGKALYSLYLKTYKSKPLSYLRSSLLDRVNRCPYCSINAPNTLDHYMPKSGYKELSVCRLNLVPLCGECNSKKSDSDYRNFIHPYYYAGPGVKEFLVVEVTVSDDLGLSTRLKISSEVQDGRQRSILENQIHELDLDTRISHELNTFLGSLFENIFVNDDHLRQTLSWKIRNVEEEYRTNDWRTALLRGLMDCPAFTFEVANKILHNRSTAVNEGAGL